MVGEGKLLQSEADCGAMCLASECFSRRPGDLGLLSLGDRRPDGGAQLL